MNKNYGFKIIFPFAISKNSETFKSVMDKFPDARLIDVNSNKDGVDND